jgi:hypothetical protein
LDIGDCRFNIADLRCGMWDVRTIIADCEFRIANLREKSRSDGFRLGGVHPTIKHYLRMDKASSVICHKIPVSTRPRVVLPCLVLSS